MALKHRDITIAAISIFVAWGFITDWAPVLRYLLYSFVTGVILTCSGIGLVLLLTVREKRHGNRKAIKSPQTVFFITPEAWKAETEWLATSAEYSRKPLLPSSFVVSDSLDGLIDWLLRDFITSWYRNITQSPAFTNEIDRAIRAAIENIKERIETRDIVGIAVLRFVPLVTAHLKDFYEAEKVVRGKKLDRNITESEEQDLAIAAKYSDGRLHQAASLAFSDTKLVQLEYLRKMVLRLMPEVLPDGIIKSRVVSVLVKEIVVCAVLGPLMQLLSNPDTWNQLMEAYGRTMVQDRKSVQKLRAALNEHASPAPKISKSYAFPKISSLDDERRFERFIREILHCNSLSDARRFRSEIAGQLKRESMMESQDYVYLRRLETGKRALDQRVAKLSAVGSSAVIQRTAGNGHISARMSNFSVEDVLRDASGLSYFMEYMDRQRLMTLIQFWVVVDGFRNPLESDLGEENDNLDGHTRWPESDRLDIAQIAEAYLSKPELKVPESSREAIRQFLKAGHRATSTQYLQARRGVLRAQSAALEEMQKKHFPNFQKSDLYYKYLTSDDGIPKSWTKPAVRMLKPPSVPPIAESTAKESFLADPMLRTTSEQTHLRRSTASSNDLQSHHKLFEDNLPLTSRRSFDTKSSAPLFDDDLEPEAWRRSLHSRYGADSTIGDQSDGHEEQMVEAMEAALSNIMTDGPALDDSKDSLIDPTGSDSIFGTESDFMTDYQRQDPVTSEKEKERPNLASLGLVNTSSRIGVFTDDDLFGDEEKFIEDEYADPDECLDEKELESEIHEAAPGDLGLAEAISALTVDIDRLVMQESIVDTLTRKAELINNVTELRILGKSMSSLQREIRQKELQRQQYIVQESDNSLFGRANVDIKSIMVGKEIDGQEFALFVIEVQRKAGENMSAASWAVARRYSEFHKLHRRLRSLYPGVRNLEFPRRRLVMKLQREFLHRRRVALEHYLRELLRLPAVCRSRDLRAFLSQQAIISTKEIGHDGERRDIVSRIYNSVTDGMDEFLGNIAVLDQLSVAGQNLISAATSQYNILASIGGPISGSKNLHSISDPTVSSSTEAQAELDAFANQALEPFVKPICDLFLETFELNRSQNWLRGRAVAVVLHQLLGGTVERKVRESFQQFTSDATLLRYIQLAKDTLWPGGVLQRERVARTVSEKAQSRREASVMLATLVPDLAGNVVGRENAKAASRRIFATANNERLNTHLAFRLLDEVVAVLFPGVR